MKDIQISRLNKLLDSSEPLSISTPYEFNGNPIPRVTTILSDMLHEDYLINWANAVGLYQHKKNTEYSDCACDIGTLVHKGIEILIRDGITELSALDFNSPEKEFIVPFKYHAHVKNCLSGFMQWWISLKNTHTVEVLMQEKALICQYYGGTVDCVIRVDGDVYVIDFKSSNHPSYKYHLQLAAYKIILETIYHYTVDGAIVLMLDKKKGGFIEQFMNFKRIPGHAEYMNTLSVTFLSLVYAYYNRKRTEDGYNAYITQMEEYYE